MIVLIGVGALVGLGVTMIAAGLQSPAPDLAGAVANLDRALTPRGPADAVSPVEHGMDRHLDRLGSALAVHLRLARYSADLAITGTTTARLALSKVAYALVGLVFPILMSAILMVAGLAIPVVAPAAVGLALAAGLSVLPEVDLRRRAGQARLEMRRTICAYLELVALERAADAGPVESLERAAAIGDGPGFDHIRQALLRARLEGRTPWTQLSALADELRVPDLADVADIMRLSGEDGAAVLVTLRARAASLRTALLQAEVAAANQASERMSIPVALLGVAFMALLGFPAFWRILFG